MQAGEVGVLIRIDSEIDLTGATITLRVKGPSDIVFRSLAMTQGVPNNFAERTTVAADFPEAGNYFIQLRATFTGPTRELISQMDILHVGEAVALLCQ